MSKLFFIRLNLLLVTMVFSFQIQGQVTVGSNNEPEKAALLDIKTQNATDGGITSDKGGLLLPRVSIDNLENLGIFPGVTADLSTTAEKTRHKGLTVYNIRQDANSNIEQGIYVWNGEKWVKTEIPQPLNFFYMPSVVINTQTTGTNFTLNLHDKYLQQFRTPAVRSDQAPTQIPFYLGPESFYYYVTDYDRNVFENISINKSGVMKYDIKAAATDGSSFMNIVFVVK